MSWGLLLTPTPALVPAATSTRYCTPVCSPPTTTERMVASTDLLTWKRVSLAKHQIWQRRTQRAEFTQRRRATLPEFMEFSALSSGWSYLILLDDAVLLVGGRRVPWNTNGGAVLTPYCQHCHLLWWGARRWWEKRKIIKKRFDVMWCSRAIFKEKCVFDHVKEGFVFHSSNLYIHAASKKTRNVPRQAWQMAAAALHLNFISSWLFVQLEKCCVLKTQPSPIVLNSSLIIWWTL